MGSGFVRVEFGIGKGVADREGEGQPGALTPERFEAGRVFGAEETRDLRGASRLTPIDHDLASVDGPHMGAEGARERRGSDEEVASQDAAPLEHALRLNLAPELC